jgi:hypothetical protein
LAAYFGIPEHAFRNIVESATELRVPSFLEDIRPAIEARRAANL